MRVELLGGPLGGTSVEWPEDADEVRFPTAEIVRAYGVRYGADTEHGRIVIAEETYRLFPQVGNLWILPAYARHVART